MLYLLDSGKGKEAVGGAEWVWSGLLRSILGDAESSGSSSGDQPLSASALLHLHRTEQTARTSVPHAPVESKKLADGHASEFTRVH